MRTSPHTLRQVPPTPAHSINELLARLNAYAPNEFIESRIIGQLVVTHPDVIAEALDAVEARRTT